MNNIRTTIQPHDRTDGKCRSAKEIAEYALERLQRSCPYGCTFIHEIPSDKREMVEAKLKESFELWANTWVAPALRQIIAKGHKPQPNHQP